LTIPLRDLDSNPPAGVFEAYSFPGDGAVSIDEWDLGDLFVVIDPQLDVFVPAPPGVVMFLSALASVLVAIRRNGAIRLSRLSP
jgi:hypothetical protein